MSEFKVDYQPESVMLPEGQQVPVPEMMDGDAPGLSDSYQWPEDDRGAAAIKNISEFCCGKCQRPAIDPRFAAAHFEHDLHPTGADGGLVGTPVSGKVLAAAGYEKLADVLHRAFQQAASGKGKERHASDGVAFEKQPMSAINELLGSIDGYLYQAAKKATEARRLPPGRDVAELLGAINYLAGAVLHLERNRSEA